ncbi:MAG TPA: hypothetical protein VHO69_03525 [Phototrophicaceae bacterium]|nr:hypothetical protein [Phototrophicaceae bacterium]
MNEEPETTLEALSNLRQSLVNLWRAMGVPQAAERLLIRIMRLMERRIEDAHKTT